MYLDTDHFARHIVTLESSLTLLNRSEPESIDYEIFRNAVVKGFELTLETGGKLLRKALKAFTWLFAMRKISPNPNLIFSF